MKQKLLILSTGISINDLEGQTDYIEENYDTLAWSCSIEWFLERNLEPTYFSYIDPHTLILAERLRKLKSKIETKLLLFSPIITHTYQTFFDNIGTTQLCTPQQQNNLELREAIFGEYCTLIDELKCDKIYIPSVGCKSLKEEIDDNPDKKFNNRELYVGSKILAQQRVNFDKLTGCCLPLAFWLGYNEVYCLGFDGLGGRFFQTNNSRGMPDFQRSYDHYLPLWNDWKKYHRMKIYSAMENSYINRHLEYKKL